MFKNQYKEFKNPVTSFLNVMGVIVLVVFGMGIFLTIAITVGMSRVFGSLWPF